MFEVASRWRVVAGLVAVLTLAACSSTDAPQPVVPQPAPEVDGVDMTYAEAMHACMQEHGFDVDVNPDGGIGGFVPVEQQDAIGAALEACNAEHGPEDSDARLSPEQIAELYPQYVELAECLESNGVIISDQPTEQQFIDRFDTEDAWDPWMEVQEHESRSRYFELLSICPTPGF